MRAPARREEEDDSGTVAAVAATTMMVAAGLHLQHVAQAEQHSVLREPVRTMGKRGIDAW